MNAMTLSLNRESLLSLMKDFFLLTGFKIALFDASGNEILSYPEKHCAFCALIRSCPEGIKKCNESNQKSFIRCEKTRELVIYHCHAGLLEVTAPLIDNDSVIGYIMFGQITSKSSEQIFAAAKILEACTFYVLLKDMIRLQRENFIQNLNQFLLSHLSEDLSVERLMQEFHLSKNKLYDSCSRYLNVGIAEHIKNLRITEAKKLLKETDLSVREISDKVGFNDYNYFCRVFKKEVGMPANRFRNL